MPTLSCAPCLNITDTRTRQFLEDPEAFTSSTLAKLMHEFNTAPPQDELARAQNELQSVKVGRVAVLVDEDSCSVDG